MTRIFRILAAMAALVGGTPSLRAQCLLCAAPERTASLPGAGGGATNGTAGETPITVVITTNLDFSRVVADSSGSITVDARSGAARASGGARALGGLAFSGRGHVEGTPGRAIRVVMPPEIVLTSSTGGQARVTDIETDLPPAPRIGMDGRLDFAFGGRLLVDGRSDGDFHGSITIDVSYE